MHASSDENEGPPFALREACGVFAVAGSLPELPRLTAFGLHALQHRGQDAAGIATLVDGRVDVVRGPGLVADVLTENALRDLHGQHAIGHVRYATAGSSHEANIQPFVLQSSWGPVALAHNGNITNTNDLRAYLVSRGAGPSGDSDTGLIAQLIALAIPRESLDQPRGALPDRVSRWIPRLRQVLERVEGAYSLVILTIDGVFAVRDRLGFRPLQLGRIGDAGDDDHTPNPPASAWVIASETCALDAVGATTLREVAPGEVVHMDPAGFTTVVAPEPQPRALCSFEYVYFSRADSVLEGQSVHAVRRALGRALALEAPAEADLVVGIPDSALPAALGYAEVSGIPYDHALVRNREVGRTFIQPSDALRRHGVRLKFHPLTENVVGRRVVLVDDSIVRGTTVKPIVRLLREAGVTEIHVRIASPSVAHPCYMGVALPDRTDLIRAHHDIPALCAYIGADSLAFLSLGALNATLTKRAASPRGHCSACFSGVYPLTIRDHDVPPR